MSLFASMKSKALAAAGGSGDATESTKSALDIVRNMTDYNPSELLSMVPTGLAGGEEEDEEKPAGPMGYAAKLVKSLVPSPENLADIYAAKVKGIKGGPVEKNISTSYKATASMDRVTNGRIFSKRASLTATQCREKGCQVFHYTVGPKCPYHTELDILPSIVVDGNKGLTEKLQANIFPTEALLDDSGNPIKQTIVDSVRSVLLRIEAHKKADVYPFDLTRQFVDKAKSLMKGATTTPPLSEIELGQLYMQFKKLDKNNDDNIDVDDIKFHINRIDSEYVKTTPADVLKEKIEEMIAQTNANGVSSTTASPSISFASYVLGLQKLRLLESNPSNPKELLQSAFWDLRACILYLPDRPLANWMLKRGYLFAKEDLNDWKRRYFKVNIDNLKKGAFLEYWEIDADDRDASLFRVETANTEKINRIASPLDDEIKDEKLKGFYPLQDIIYIDFSLKTKVSATKEMTKNGINAKEQIVFKVSFMNGRRITLAADRDTATTWVAELSLYSCASRLISEWKENWGTTRKTKITLRDWINAGAAIAKYGMYKKLEEDLKGGKGDKKKIEKEMKEYAQTPRDDEALRICKLDGSNMETAGGVVLTSIKLFQQNKTYLKQLDSMATGGAIGYSVQGLIAAVQVWNYAKYFKNRLNQNKYGVQWESKSGTRSCEVCKSVFKSATVRNHLRKHHCRSCGVVVCSACLSVPIYMKHVDEYVRVCTDCVKNKGPPKERLVTFDGGKAAMEAVKKQVQDVAVAEVKGALGIEDEEVESDDSDSDDSAVDE